MVSLILCSPLIEILLYLCIFVTALQSSSLNILQNKHMPSLSLSFQKYILSFRNLNTICHQGCTINISQQKPNFDPEEQLRYVDVNYFVNC